ncbi:ABC transporter permease subunit [Elusimicrobiota bacterium]
MHGMITYFARRVMLIPVTFLCITFMVYAVLRVVPGGPIEQAEMQIKMAAMQEGGGGMADEMGQMQIPEEAMEELKKYYHLDKPIPVGYLNWLWGIVRLDFGQSYVHGEAVLKVIVSKFPISIYFGLIGYFASWIICIPLGVTKAIKHRSAYDTGTSVLVFLGYSIPGFVACLILLVLFGGGTFWDVFPLGGFRSEPDIWSQLGFFGKIKDQLHHTAIPVFGYLIGGFATMTILMKNSLLDNLGADYVRTAFAKGLSERRVIFVHAMRNSLIPITAGIGHALGLLFAGSFLIEKTCNIPGMGLLGYNSIIQRDYPVILGTLVFLVLIRLTGNIFSDIAWALIDPRIRFSK